MSFIGLLAWTLAIAVSYMTFVWVVSLMLRNASIVDSFWGPGFALLAAALPLLAGGPTWRSLLVLSMVAVWAARLAAHVTVRNWGKREDWRYRKWRDEAPGSFWWRSYFRVFLLQGGLLVVVAAPILLTAWSGAPTRLAVLDVVGIAVWGFGLLFEAVADGQLARFKREPQSAGKVMDRGLWRYSRHPNYFGESVLWWGIFLVSASVPTGYAAIVGPIAITFLLLRVSGVRMLERGLRTRRPGYEDYVRRTSAFLPLPPKRRRLGWRERDSQRIVCDEEGTLNDELRQALDFAIEKEQEAEAFYKEWAAKVSSPAVVAIFAELAATERGHFEMLSRITPEDLAGLEAPAEGDLKISEQLVDVEASEGMGVQEAMILAMKREASAAALYDELARLGGETQSLFEALAKEERAHKQRLEAEYDQEILTEN